MALVKNFRAESLRENLSPIHGGNVSRSRNTGGGLDALQPDNGYKNYQSYLPDVYSGHPNRINRYMQYENMDLDSEVNTALDVLAQFCTGKSEETNTPFEFEFNKDATDAELKVLNEELKTWCSLNEFNKRMFKMFRNVLKYGDQVFLRDPETFELSWVQMDKVVRVIVNESEGKDPEYYVIRDLSPNFQNLTATAPAYDDIQFTPTIGGPTSPYMAPNNTYSGDSRFQKDEDEANVEAQHICHLSLTEGLDANWPFGNSVLENIFKVYKQKELLEDSIIIYRVQRAPERRVFYIDVGGMPSHMAMSFVERVKNEIHQRRIPTQNGGGQNVLDSTYNPLSINEDYFFPQTAEGRGSKVETLPGGENLGQIDDLRYFTNKLFRGLRIPPSYIPTGPEQGSSQPYNDGRVGTALIEENTFNEYCKQLQKYIGETLDLEFKMYLRWRGYNIENAMFNIALTAPQNFAQYRLIELDSTRINTFNSIKDTPYLSKRFMLEKYLGLSESEIARNEELLLEEMGETEDGQPSGEDLRSADITPGGIESDLGELDLDTEEGEDEFGDEDFEEPEAGSPNSETNPDE